jgi:hypothetical protein
MSKAVICDRCGSIFALAVFGSEPVSHAIWLHNPFLDSGGDEYAEVHLCNECYGLFKAEYLGNLLGESNG